MREGELAAGEGGVEGDWLAGLAKGWSQKEKKQEGQQGRWVFITGGSEYNVHNSYGIPILRIHSIIVIAGP